MSDSPAPARVGIVMAAYNGEAFLQETLASISAQTLRDWECVIVDDGSVDRTLAIAQAAAAADPRFRVVAQPNRGVSAARNYGLTLLSAQVNYVTFMDCDDLWLPEALADLVAEAEKDPAAVGVHALARCIDRQGTVYADADYEKHGRGRFVFDRLGRRVDLLPGELTSFRSLWFSNPFPPGLILARREAYAAVGPFDVEATPVEDWDILLRLSRHGGFRFLGKVIMSYRRHQNNLSARSAHLTAVKLRRLIQKTFFAPENNQSQRRIVRENWRASQLSHARQKMRAALAAFAGANLKSAALNFAGIFVQLFRFARGYPTLRRL